MPAKNTNDFGAVENKIELARVGMAWVGTSDTSLCKVLPIGCLGRMQQSSILVFALIFFFFATSYQINIYSFLWKRHFMPWKACTMSKIKYNNKIKKKKRKKRYTGRPYLVSIKTFLVENDTTDASPLVVFWHKETGRTLPWFE